MSTVKAAEVFTSAWRSRLGKVAVRRGRNDLRLAADLPTLRAIHEIQRTDDTFSFHRLRGWNARDPYRSRFPSAGIHRRAEHAFSIVRTAHDQTDVVRHGADRRRDLRHGLRTVSRAGARGGRWG